MKTQIVTAVIDISKANEMKHFEIRIPENTIAIFGVETSMRLIENPFLRDNKFGATGNPKNYNIAELRLQGGKHCNWFYAKTIKDNMWLENTLDFYAQQCLMKTPYIFHSAHDVDTCQMPLIATRIKGYLKDNIGVRKKLDIQYQITICLHLQIQ